MKKIGLLSLALVLALGTLGIAYAAWTDTITVEGTVNTGDVDLDITALSSTWVYKVPGVTDEIVVNHALIPGIHATTDPDPPASGILVASATADIVSLTDYADNIVTMTFDNLFPCIPFVADVLWHYDGSIPVKVNEISIEWDAGTDPLLIELAESAGGIAGGDIYALMYHTNETGTEVGEGIVVGDQLHECDYVKVVFYIHIPQDNDYMNLSGSFTATLEVVQWNEYPHNGG